MELTVDLDDEVHEMLSRRAKENSFESTEAYCRTVLELTIEELEDEDRDEAVEERLEDLGYLS